MNLYQVNDVFYSYEKNLPPTLRSINLQVQRGEFLCLTGPSGSGKSTLVNILGLLTKQDAGEVIFCGQSLSELTERDLDRLRRHEIGFVFQDHQLIEVLSVEENVEYFLCRQNVPRKERRELVRQALESVGLWQFRQARPQTLSGGQRQRVSIARALAKRPSVIIADEPTASLDRKSSAQILDIFRNLAETQLVTVIAATHDLLALNYADRSLEMVDGIINNAEVKQHAG